MMLNIKSLPKVGNIEESVKLFLEIYKTYSIDEWINSDRIFEVSNEIARYRPDLISVGIRLNVQVNLFLRTIHSFDKEKLDIVKNHELGCFGLTENRAGVLSGLMVDTEFEKTEKNYILNTPENIYKNWISQGIVSEYVLLFAKNTNNKNDIRIFILDNRTNNCEIKQINNISITRTLDLAKIKCRQLVLPHDSVLKQTIEIDKTQLLNGIYYGRHMISEAVVSSILGLIDHCEHLAQNKYKKLNHPIIIIKYKQKFNKLLKMLQHDRSTILSNQDIIKINIYKIYSVESAINSFSILTQLFGTHTLSYPLKYEDLLLNKIAEGDTDVLRLMILNNEIQKGYIHNIFFGHIPILSLATLNKKNIMSKYKHISNIIINKTIGSKL